MECPRCKNSSGMESMVVESIELDRCPKCLGMWFDGGEFKELKEKAGQGKAAEVSVIDAADIQGKKFAPTKESICCPRCNQAMNEFNFMYSSGVFVDQCELCEGIWFDEGEFKKILDYIREVSAPMTDAEYSKLAPLLARDRSVGMAAEEKTESSIGSTSALGKTLRNVYTLLRLVS
jgi:uncharacterized protein